jgi:HEAT repeat protein
MKTFHKAAFFLILLSLLIQGFSHAQPTIPVDIIPKDISPAVKTQIETLYSQDPVERIKAVIRLGEMGSEAIPAIPFLIGLLGDTNTVLLSSTDTTKDFTSSDREAAKALLRIGDASVEPLINALKDTNSNARENAAEALGEMDDPRAVEPLITALKDKNSDVRKIAAKSLGQLHDERAVKPLINALKDHEVDVRKNAAESLGCIGDKQAIEPLVSALRDKKSKVQESANEALKKIIDVLKKKNDIETLIALLKNDEIVVRRTAVKACYEIRDPCVVIHFIEALQDKDAQVSDNAREALQEIGASAVEELIVALKHEDVRVRVAAATILGEIRDPRAVDPLFHELLLAILQNKSRVFRAEAVKSLGKIRDPRAVKPLIEALQDKDAQVSDNAREALQKIGAPAVEELIVALKHEDVRVRVAAATILGEIRDPRAVDPLINALLLDALENTSWMFRAEAARALGKIKDPRAVKPLSVVLNDRDSDVRANVEWALEEITGKNYDQDQSKYQEWSEKNTN